MPRMTPIHWRELEKVFLAIEDCISNVLLSIMRFALNLGHFWESPADISFTGFNNTVGPALERWLREKGIV